MRYLAMSDIHNNLEAMQKIIDELNNLHIDKILFIGDILGYGKAHNRCFALAREYGNHFVYGNYEYNLALYINNKSHTSKVYSELEQVLSCFVDDDFLCLEKFKLIDIVDSLITLSHGNPKTPELFSYVSNYYDAQTAFDYFSTPLCFMGHTHISLLHTEGEYESKMLKAEKIYLSKNKRYIVNCGSVGQPRDNDKRPSCIVFDSEEYSIENLRLDYRENISLDKRLINNDITFKKLL